MRKGIVALELDSKDGPSPVYIKLNAPAHSVWLGGAEGYTYDLEGRPFAAFFNERRFRRALDGRVIETVWVTGARGLRHRRVRLLEGEEKSGLLRRFRERVQPVYAAVSAGRYRLRKTGHPHEIQPDRDALRQLLQTIFAWDDARLAADVVAFHRVYRPVSILPPDQYLALYIQMTLGCYYNRCVFCDFYRDRPYRELDDAGFLRHLEAVEHYFGHAIRMRKTLFLGDANALHMPADALLRRFEILNQRYRIGRRAADDRLAFSGIYSFIDAFTGAHLSRDVLTQLTRLGLRRVYLGFETGHDPLRHLLQKPGKTQQVIEAVQNLKQAGVSVGVILLNGIGGRTFFETHLRDSLAALQAMPLDAQDMIYLSDLMVCEDSDYRTVAQRQGWDLLSAEELHAQRQQWLRALRSDERLRHVKVANYDIREFVY
ncbi:MAG: radical SAM protein [candidate division KSB1 bacterium]|nr:radical SAM protein [candidate division KSB1 bacterium]